MDSSIALDRIQVDPKFMAREIARGRKYFVLLLEKGPKEAADQAQADALMQQHILHQFRLRNLGKLVVNGPVFDEHVRGFGIFNASSIDEVQRYVALDPLVLSGLRVAKVYPWMGFPGDRLP